jgi:phosphatidylserine decarboxylase
MKSFFVVLQYVLPKPAISKMVGALTRLEVPWLTQAVIRVFIKAYGVDMDEAAEPDVRAYRNFNAFFTRALAGAARPVADGPGLIVSPADGSISQIGVISGTSIVQAKGIDYELTDLFDGDADLAARFERGGFATIYLAPHNYHRVHIPLAGRARFLRYVPGTLFSVDEGTTQRLKCLFCRNERVIALFDTPGGWFALIMVGAMNVGNIDLMLPEPGHFHNRPHASCLPHQTLALDARPFSRGDEFGRFNMGSTVILMTSAGLVEWNATLGPRRAIKMGQVLGQVRAAA